METLLKSLPLLDSILKVFTLVLLVILIKTIREAHQAVKDNVIEEKELSPLEQKYKELNDHLTFKVGSLTVPFEDFIKNFHFKTASARKDLDFVLGFMVLGDEFRLNQIFVDGRLAENLRLNVMTNSKIMYPVTLSVRCDTSVLTIKPTVNGYEFTHAAD